MAEYIEREAFLEDLKLRHCKDCNNHNWLYCSACWVDDMFDEIEDAPAADVVEVVRCKDCKFYKYGDCWNLQWEDREGNMPYVKEDDFCSYGERKDNDNRTED